MAESYGEPWSCPNYDATILRADGMFIGQFNTEAEARRAKACVNALAGMDPDKLVGLIAACGRLIVGHTEAVHPPCRDCDVRDALAALLGQGEKITLTEYVPDPSDTYESVFGLAESEVNAAYAQYNKDLGQGEGAAT